MIKSKKRTIGILSVIALLCTCLFFVSIIGNTRTTAYADAPSVDLTQAANYTIGTAEDLAAFTSVDGVTSTAGMPNVWEIASAQKAAPTVVAEGLQFSIPYGFSVGYPVVFNTPLSISGGIEKLTFTVNCDLSSADNSYGCHDGGPIWGTKGVYIYPLNATGAVGEGLLIPYDVTQRQDVELIIQGSTLANFMNANGEVEGFIIAACIGSAEYSLGSTAVLKFYGAANVVVKSALASGKTVVFETTDTIDLTDVNAYSLGGASGLTAIDGLTSASYPGGQNFSFTLQAKTPSATANGINFAIPAGFSDYEVIKFNKHIVVEEGDKLYVTLNADLSTLNNSFGHANGGYPSNPWGAEIMIYPLTATGAAGEGYQIPYTINQRKDIVLTIEGDKLQEFVEDGKIKGVLIASACPNFKDYPDGLKSNANITIKSFSTVNPYEVITETDFVDGSVTLFTANGDYTAVADPVAIVDGMTPDQYYAGHGAKTSLMNYDNISTLNLPAVVDGDVTPYFSYDAMKAGTDGYAVAMELSPWGITKYPEIRFDKKVKADDITSLSFRIFANLSDGAYVGGYICLFGAGSTYQSGTGVRIATDITQREWVNLVITGDDLAKLADADGYISGFCVGSYIINDSKAGTTFYQNGNSGWNANKLNQNKYDRVASLFIDSIIASKKPDEGVKFMSISTEGDIGVNFYAYLEDAKTATFTFKGETSEAVDGVYDEETGCYKFTYAVAPVDYKEEIQINIGEDIEATYSVYQYSQDINEESDAYALVVALMDYCEAANVYFNNDVAEETEALDVDLSAYASSISGSDDRLNVIGASLILEDKTSIYVYFEAEDINGIEFAVDGEAVEPVAVAGKYVIKIENIVAKDLDKTFTITVGGYTITYSALSYVNTVNNGEYGVALANVVKAIYAVSVQAEAYFA